MDGICIGLDSVAQAVSLEKWQLHPVLIIACCIGEIYGGEDLKIELSNELLIVKLFCLFDEAFLGIPPV